jgi:hypothetical protein
MLTLLVANPRNKISQFISFSDDNMSLFFIYSGSVLIWFHNGSSVCIILCILFRPLRCVVRACQNLPVFINIVMAKRKCSINGSIKSEYPFIKYMNEDAECTLCNAKFCIARDGRSDVVNDVKTRKHKLAVQNLASNNSISNCLGTKNVIEMQKQLSLAAQEATFAYHTAVHNHYWFLLLFYSVPFFTKCPAF